MVETNHCTSKHAVLVSTRLLASLVDDWDAVRTSKYAEGVEILKPAVDAMAGHDGLVMFAVNVDDAHATAERFRAVGREVTVTEVWLEEKNAGFVEVLVRDAPTYFPFFITYSLGLPTRATTVIAGVTVISE